MPTEDSAISARLAFLTCLAIVIADLQRAIHTLARKTSVPKAGLCQQRLGHCLNGCFTVARYGTNAVGPGANAFLYVQRIARYSSARAARVVPSAARTCSSAALLNSSPSRE